MEHDVIPLGERHAPHNWEYADATLRAAASGFVSTDVNKIALQLDDGSYWRLSSIAPITWVTTTKAAGAGSGYGQWKWSTSLTGDPTSGKVAVNSATAASITELRISDMGSDGIDYSAPIGAIRPGDTLYIQDKDTASQWLRFNADGLAVDNGTYWTIPVVYVGSAGGMPANNHEMVVQVTYTNEITIDDVTGLRTELDTITLGLWDDRGSFDASVNTYPTSGGSGTAGAIVRGDIWTIGVVATAGPLFGQPVGTTVRALTDAPGQTVGNWAIAGVGTGYVPENAALKDVSSGYAGLTQFKLNLKNAAGTVLNWFTNATTAARTWTLPDKDGTVAMTSDVNDVKVETATHAAATKVVPADADELPLVDSATSWGLKNLTWANLKAALASATQTLTNKTLTNPVVTNYVETMYAPAAGTAFTVDLANGTYQKFTTTGNATITLPASVAGKSYLIEIAYGGAHTVTFAGGTSLKPAGGSYPTATSVNGKSDLYAMLCDGTVTKVRDAGRNF